VAFEAKYAVEKPRLVVGFLALFSFIAAAALRAAWRGTFHNIFQLLAQLLDVGILGRHPFGFLGDALNRADTSVYNWLGHLKDASGHAFITLVLWIAMQITMVVVALAALSYELLRYAHIIGHRTSVTVVKKTVNVVTRPIAHDATKGRVAHDSRVPALEREIESLRARVGEMDAAIAKVQAVAIPVPLPLPRPRAAPVPVPVPIPVPQTIPKVGDIQKGLDWVRGKVNRLGKLGTIAGLIGLVAGSLARLGISWARCSNVKRYGRSICGMDSRILNALLGASTLIVGTISLVQFAEFMVETEKWAADDLLKGIRELRGIKAHTFSGYSGTL
jgi:hypothetical protein